MSYRHNIPPSPKNLIKKFKYQNLISSTFDITGEWNKPGAGDL